MGIYETYDLDEKTSFKFRTLDINWEFCQIVQNHITSSPAQVPNFSFSGKLAFGWTYDINTLHRIWNNDLKLSINHHKNVYIPMR